MMIVRARFAAPAPERERVQRSNRLEAEVHNTCVEWSSWCRSRGRFGAPRPVGSVLRQLVEVTGGGDGPNGVCRQDLALFHQAVIHAADQRARQLFEAHYLLRGLNVSSAAEAVGISRTHWYRLVNGFAREVYRQSIGTGY